MSKVALLRDSEIGLLNPNENKIKAKNNPLSQYNYVILNYNSEYCLVDGIRLKTIREPLAYSMLYPLFNNPFGAALLLIMLMVVPLVNVPLFLAMIYAIRSYFVGLKVFENNIKKNPDPFRNMIFSAEICESINSINWGFDIVVTELEGLSLNQDIVSSLTLKNSEGKIKFMVYNNVFWNYFHDFPEYKRFHVVWLALSTVSFLFSGIFYYIYCNLIINHHVWG